MKIKVKWNLHSVLAYVYPKVHSVDIDPKNGTISFFDKEKNIIDDGIMAEANSIEIEDVATDATDNSAEVAKLQKTNEMEADRALHYRTLWQDAIKNNHSLKVDELAREVAELKMKLHNNVRRLSDVEASAAEKQSFTDQLLMINKCLKKEISNLDQVISDLRLTNSILSKDNSKLNETVESLNEKNKVLHDFIQKKQGTNNSNQDHWHKALVR
jgi:hypothetical protein